MFRCAEKIPPTSINSLKITDRAYIINNGGILRAGSPLELSSDPQVRKIYLGEQFVDLGQGQRLAGGEQGGFDDALQLGDFHRGREHQGSISTTVSAATVRVRT